MMTTFTEYVPSSGWQVNAFTPEDITFVQASGIHANGREVHVPELSVPTLKSRIMRLAPPGGVTLNWNVRGPAPLSVAVAAHVMAVPTTCGDTGEGVIDTIETVAEAGLHNATSSAAKHKKPFFGIFIRN